VSVGVIAAVVVVVVVVRVGVGVGVGSELFVVGATTATTTVISSILPPKTKGCPCC